MFDTLRDIRYDGSEQLSKGASEISQRIHNFFTIIRQVRKGNPVVKEETINEFDFKKLILDNPLDRDWETFTYLSNNSKEVMNSLTNF